MLCERLAAASLTGNFDLSHTFDALERYIRFRPHRSKLPFIGNFLSHRFDYQAVSLTSC